MELTDDDPLPTSIVSSKTKQKYLVRIKLNPGFPISDQAETFRRRYFPQVAREYWNDWRWQLANRIDASTLRQFFELSEAEDQALRQGGQLPLKITPYYASLLSRTEADQALRKTVIPTYHEFIHSAGEAADPLGEDHSSPVEGIVHRYPDRVLFLVTDFCSTNCRYCTRSRVVGCAGHSGIGRETWQRGIDYIAAHSEIRDVLISGGDPLTMDDEKIEWLLQSLRAIPHVEIIRIGTKVPMVLPQRVTPALVRMLKKYHPLWISVHCTHPEELTPESSKSFERLANAGIPLGSQTVLLKGINDSVPVMTELMHRLMKNRVKPYYLYQCDPILGSSHFRTTVEKGLEIIEGLRGHTSGYAVPHYVIDAPGGGGKIPLLPDYFKGQENGQVVLRNYEGKTYYYPNRETQ